MQMTLNLFKRALHSQVNLAGLFLGLADANSAEIIATAGFDWLLIDAEHGPNDLRSIKAQLQVLAAYPVHSVVRVPSHDAALIKQVLDIGAQTLMVPMVNSAAQALDLVRAMHYPPKGIRGVGTAMARAARWNAIEDYFAHADAEQCLIVQVESIEGLKALPEILQVDGVDAVFIGPSDLAASMGHLGNPAHSEVKSAVCAAIECVVDAGKGVGVFVADLSAAQAYQAMGARLLLVGVDALLLRHAATDLAAKFKNSDTRKLPTAGAAY